MALDIFFKENIGRILAALRQANIKRTTTQSKIQEPSDAFYCRGYLDALDDVAVALGVVEPERDCNIIEARLCRIE